MSLVHRPVLPYLLPGALIFASRSPNSARWVLCFHSSLWDYAVRFAACKIPFEVFSLPPFFSPCCESLKIHFMLKLPHVFEHIDSSECNSALNVNLQYSFFFFFINLSFASTISINAVLSWPLQQHLKTEKIYNKISICAVLPFRWRVWAVQPANKGNQDVSSLCIGQ